MIRRKTNFPFLIAHPITDVRAPICFGDFQRRGMAGQRVLAAGVAFTGAVIPTAEGHRFPKQGRTLPPEVVIQAEEHG
jgi:hypothetical protein